MAHSNYNRKQDKKPLFDSSLSFRNTDKVIPGKAKDYSTSPMSQTFHGTSNHSGFNPQEHGTGNAMHMDNQKLQRPKSTAFHNVSSGANTSRDCSKSNREIDDQTRYESPTAQTAYELSETSTVDPNAHAPMTSDCGAGGPDLDGLKTGDSGLDDQNSNAKNIEERHVSLASETKNDNPSRQNLTKPFTVNIDASGSNDDDHCTGGQRTGDPHIDVSGNRGLDDQSSIAKKSDKESMNKPLQTEALLEENARLKQSLEQLMNETEAKIKEKDDEIKTLKGERLEEKTKDDKEHKKIRLQLKDELSRWSQEYKSLEKHYQRTQEKYETILKGRDDEIRTLKRETSDLKLRLSKIAGEKMTAGNSDISDLSDQDRALKLSEKFSSLYDDEWTDAHEYLTEKMIISKDESIHYLLEVLKDCYNHCIKTSEAQIDSITNVLLFPDQSVSTQPDRPKSEEIDKQSKHRLLSLRRSISSKSIQLVKQQYMSAVKQSVKKEKDKKAMLEGCMPYYEKCIDICWRMVLHDPPMYISFDIKQGDRIDKDFFKPYDNSGDVCEFMVWPPLFVEKKGGVLSKGVVKPESDRPTSGRKQIKS